MALGIPPVRLTGERVPGHGDQAGRDALIFVGGKDVGVNGDRSQRDAVSGPRGRRQHQVRRRRDGQRRPVVLGQVVGVKAQPVV
jgi:hypothetical protein